jgi:hypothetical protein
VLLAAIAMAARGLRRRRAAPLAPVLSGEEEEKLRSILAESEVDPPPRD